MVLETVQKPDDTGASELAKGLEIIDELFANTHDVNTMLSVVGGQGARLANTTSKLMRRLDDNDAGFTCGRATPRLLNAHSGGIPRDDSGSLSDVLFPHGARMVDRRVFASTLLQSNLRTGRGACVFSKQVT